MQGQRFNASKPAPEPKGQHGGWRGSQASLDALARCRPTWGDHRRCRCGRVAMATRPTCSRHSGAFKGRPPSKNPARLAARELARLKRAGLLPPQLVEMDCFRRVYIGRVRLSIYALAMLDAWNRRAEDPLGWANAVREARQAVEA